MKNKVIEYILIVFSLMSFLSCEELSYPTPDSTIELNSLRAIIIDDSTDVTSEVDLLSGTYNEDKGLISYVFTLGDQITEESLSNCRIEASINSTSTLELIDEAGNGLGKGFDGKFDLNNCTIFFKITAADKTYKTFQLTCKTKN